MVVIGLAGGIASGKSRVATEFAALGCVVVDYDGLAREALDVPEVRSMLEQWWGGGVIGEDGTVNRRAVAEIVFVDRGQRERLEGVVHPMVLDQGRHIIDQARRDGAPGVVVDAPLLFEAGLDEACDAVVFVDAQHQTRLERVTKKRGWAPEELDKRELTQISLVEKRRRSEFVVVNNQDKESLRRQVAEVFGRLRTRQGPDAG